MVKTESAMCAVARELGVDITPPGSFVDGSYLLSDSALTVGGYTYCTIEVAGVKIALSATDIFVHNGHVWLGDSTVRMVDTLVIAGVVTPPKLRRQGHATLAMTELCRAASRAGIVLKLEPAPISSEKARGQRLASVSQLRKFYARFGFVGTQIMTRQP